MALAYILLLHDMNVVKLAITRPVAVREFEDMRETWNTVFDAFGRRLKVLWEVWRQQRLDLKSQVQYYCRGLFRGWHERVCISRLSRAEMSVERSIRTVRRRGRTTLRMLLTVTKSIMWLRPRTVSTWKTMTPLRSRRAVCDILFLPNQRMKLGFY